MDLSRPWYPLVAIAVSAILAAVSFADGRTSTRADPTCLGERATILGTTRAETLTGTNRRDVIFGGPGIDRIDGAGGNDLICGDLGSDQIDGGPGSDTIYGGLGDDRVVGDRGTDFLFGEDGEDQLLGDRGNDRLDGGLGSGDRLEGSFGDDIGDGGDGDADVVLGGAGNDGLTGGPGDADVVSGDRGADSLDGGDGVHDVVSYASFSLLGGSAGPLHIALGPRGGAGGGGERDVLTGFEDVIGSPAPDSIDGDGGPNSIFGGEGTDSISGDDSGADPSIPMPPDPGDYGDGGPGTDYCTDFEIEVNCGPDDSQSDRLGTAVGVTHTRTGRVLRIRSKTFANGFNNDIEVSKEDDRLLVTDVDVLLVGAGCRTVTTTSASCDVPRLIEIVAEEGDDHVAIGSSVPASIGVSIYGGLGSDQLQGGRGADLIDSGGGPGESVDDVDGGSGSDELIGSTGPDQIGGGPGDDLLVASSPCDRQRYDGGSGDDSLSFAHSTRAVTARLDGSAALVKGCKIGSPVTQVERFEGSAFDDVLRGQGDSNRLLGRAGNDLLIGGGGSDGLVGGSGADRLLGGPGEDKLFARDGSRDFRIDCGTGRARIEVARRDASDPRAFSC